MKTRLVTISCSRIDGKLLVKTRLAKPVGLASPNHTIERLPWFGNAEISADLPRQEVADLTMPWNRGASLSGRIAPPGMAGALANERATVLSQMRQEIATLHRSTSASSKSPWVEAMAS